MAAHKLTQLQRMGRMRQPQQRFGMKLLDALAGDVQRLSDSQPGLWRIARQAVAGDDDVGQPAGQRTYQVVQGVADQAMFYLAYYLFAVRGQSGAHEREEQRSDSCAWA